MVGDATNVSMYQYARYGMMCLLVSHRITGFCIRTLNALRLKAGWCSGIDIVCGTCNWPSLYCNLFILSILYSDILGFCSDQKQVSK